MIIKRESGVRTFCSQKRSLVKTAGSQRNELLQVSEYDIATYDEFHIYIQEGHVLMGIAEVRTIYEGAQE